jgi:hypothetical protein
MAGNILTVGLCYLMKKLPVTPGLINATLGHAVGKIVDQKVGLKFFAMIAIAIFTRSLSHQIIMTHHCAPFSKPFMNQ